MPRSLIRNYEEVINISDYLIIRREYANFPAATLEYVELMQQDKEAIKEKLIPKIAGMIGK